uniref:PWWP domain-containing protein n=1 Tax=Strongyloides papillosus TaxID=174720 RepID=A0A0N5BEV9_STREA
MATGRKFAVNDLVWAKMKGFPHWPGKVIQVPKFNGKGVDSKYMVIFFGTNEHAYLKDTELCHYLENREKYEIPNKKKSFELALKEVREAAGLDPGEPFTAASSTETSRETSLSTNQEPKEKTKRKVDDNEFDHNEFNEHSDLYEDISPINQNSIIPNIFGGSHSKKDEGSFDFNDLILPKLRGRTKSCSTRKSNEGSFSAYMERARQTFERCSGFKSKSLSSGGSRKKRQKGESFSFADNISLFDYSDLDAINPTILENLDLDLNLIGPTSRSRLPSEISGTSKRNDLQNLFKSPRDRIPSISQNSFGGLSIGSEFFSKRNRLISGTSDFNFDAEFNPHEFLKLLDHPNGVYSDSERISIVQQSDLIEGKNCTECGYSCYICNDRYKCARESCQAYNERVPADKLSLRKDDRKTKEEIEDQISGNIQFRGTRKRPHSNKSMYDTTGRQSSGSNSHQQRSETSPNIVAVIKREDGKRPIKVPKLDVVPLVKQKKKYKTKSKRPVGRPRKNPTPIPSNSIAKSSSLYNISNGNLVLDPSKKSKIWHSDPRLSKEVELQTKEKYKVLHKKAKFTPPAGFGGIRLCFICQAQVRPQQSTKNKHRWRCIGKNCRKWYGWVNPGDEIPLDFGNRGHWKGLNFSILRICKNENNTKTLKYVSFVDFNGKTGEVVRLPNGCIGRIVRRCFNVSDLSEAGVTEKNFDGSIIRPRHMMNGYDVVSKFNKNGLEIHRSAFTATLPDSRSSMCRTGLGISDGLGNFYGYKPNPIYTGRPSNVERTVLTNIKNDSDCFVVEDDKSPDSDYNLIDPFSQSKIRKVSDYLNDGNQGIKKTIRTIVDPTNSKTLNIPSDLPVPVEEANYEMNPGCDPEIITKIISQRLDILSKQDWDEENQGEVVDKLLDMTLCIFPPLLKIMANFTEGLMLPDETERELANIAVNRIP